MRMTTSTSSSASASRSAAKNCRAQRRRQRVAGLRPVQRQRAHPVGGVDQQHGSVVAAHRIGARTLAMDRMCRNITELRGLEPAGDPRGDRGRCRGSTSARSAASPSPMRRWPRYRCAPRRSRSPPSPSGAERELPARRQPPKTVPPLRRPEVRARLAAGAAAPGDRGRRLTQPALKEWSAAVHALLDGRQTVLLRKGEIDEKRFEVGGVAVPAVPDGRPQSCRAGPSRAPRTLGARRSGQHRRRRSWLRATARVVAAVEVNCRRSWMRLRRLHIWTAESVRADRLDFRPRHRLTVLVVQASPLVEPVRLARTPEYGGLQELGSAAGRTRPGRPRCTTTSALQEIAGARA